MIRLNELESTLQNLAVSWVPGCTVDSIKSGWWFGTLFIFQNIWDVILPIDEVIFFKMVNTTNQKYFFATAKMIYLCWKYLERISLTYSVIEIILNIPLHQ